MRSLLLFIIGCLSLSAADWFSIDQPESYEPGQPYRVTIVVTKEDLAGKYLHADIHSMKFNGRWGGLQANGGGGREITSGKAEIYNFNFTPSNGVAGAIGTKIGFSAVLADNDGQGLGGRLSWGGGLIPSWAPDNAGVVTFVE